LGWVVGYENGTIDNSALTTDQIVNKSL